MRSRQVSEAKSRRTILQAKPWIKNHGKAPLQGHIIRHKTHGLTSTMRPVRGNCSQPWVQGISMIISKISSKMLLGHFNHSDGLYKEYKFTQINIQLHLSLAA